jgi:hypothetical protein
MLNGNLYGLVITLLTFVITVVLTMRQVQETGVRFELIIQPVKQYAVAGKPETGSETKPSSALQSAPQAALKERPIAQ